MSKKISFNLSARSVKQAAKELLDYKKSLVVKCSTFVRRLADQGILVAQDNLGEFGRYVTFEVQVDPGRYGARALLIATNTGHITSQWISKDEDGNEVIREADVSPLMMAEFGSGLIANNVRAHEFGMGTGTFPEQTHAEEPDGWWYMDLDREWHHSYGIRPTMPMWKAAVEMNDVIVETAREVFGS